MVPDTSPAAARARLKPSDAARRLRETSAVPAASERPPSHLLYLLRHAKSSWDNPGLSDHERPLAPRGRKAARLIARHLDEAGIRPALVLCSAALRARQTYECVRPAGELVIEPLLYGASAGAVAERVRAVPEAVASVMVIGHNPAMQALAVGLAADEVTGAADEQLETLREKFPTCALATLRLSGPWNALAPGSCQLLEVVRPADLMTE